MEMTFRPLTTWPGLFTASPRKSSPFKASYSETLRLLDKELQHLKAKNVVVQLAIGADEIRLDGRPYERARPRHPGIILAFDSKHGPLSYPCDTFSDWQANLRAIALALEHLRTVDRYGVTKQGEQYRGWTALPGPKPDSTPTLDKAEAVRLLQKYVAGVITGPEEAKVAYKAAVMATHPDRGGNPEDFKRVQEAKQVLGLD